MAKLFPHDYKDQNKDDKKEANGEDNETEKLSKRAEDLMNDIEIGEHQISYVHKLKEKFAKSKN